MIGFWHLYSVIRWQSHLIGSTLNCIEHVVLLTKVPNKSNHSKAPLDVSIQHQPQDKQII